MNEILYHSIESFYDDQFRQWPEVKQNYENLCNVERRTVNVNGWDVILQYSPARGKSTFAKVDKASVEARPCFLCERNRPKQQIAGKEFEGFEILVNPYPILPVHFTIVAKDHDPQGEMPLDMVEFVSKYPSLVAFFNGAESGASAPDHLHFQGVLKEELPLLREVEKLHPSTEPGIRLSSDFGRDFHSHFISVVVAPDFDGLRLLSRLPKLHPGTPHKINAFVWLDAQGWLRTIIFPRKAHRPSQYFEEDENAHFAVSPGALDMAGLLVLPRKEDFTRLDAATVVDIYRQTGVNAEELKQMAEEYNWLKDD